MQPQGNKLRFAFSRSLAAGACVRVCLVRPPHAPSLRRCPQLSTLVRDHRGKSLCSREVGCLAKCPNPTQAQLGGAGALAGSPGGSGGNVSVGRCAPQVVPHSLTHSLTHSPWSCLPCSLLAGPLITGHLGFGCTFALDFGRSQSSKVRPESPFHSLFGTFESNVHLWSG